MKSRNVFLGPGILTPSGLESRILQPKTKFPYQGVVVGVVVVVQNPGFYYSKFVFSLKWRLYHMYLQSPRLDTIVYVLHFSFSENTKTVFLLLVLHLVSSFVKFMLTTQLFFFAATVFSGTSAWYVQWTGMDVKLQRLNLASRSRNKFFMREKMEIIYTTKISEE